MKRTILGTFVAGAMLTGLVAFSTQSLQAQSDVSPGIPDSVEQPPTPRDGGMNGPRQPMGQPMMGQPMGGGGGATMVAEGEYLYILRGNQLLKVKTADLSVAKRTDLPAPGGGREGGREGGRNGDRPGGPPPRDGSE